MKKYHRVNEKNDSTKNQIQIKSIGNMCYDGIVQET